MLRWIKYRASTLNSSSVSRLGTNYFFHRLANTSPINSFSMHSKQYGHSWSPENPFISRFQAIISNRSYETMDKKGVSYISSFPPGRCYFCSNEFLCCLRRQQEIYEWPHLNAPPFATASAHKYPLTPPSHLRFAVINISCNDFCYNLI